MSPMEVVSRLPNCIHIPPSDRVNSQLNSIEGEWRFTSSILRLDASTLFNGNGKRNLNRFHFFIC